MSDRAVLFIDGGNWFHSLKKLGVDDLGRLDYSAVSRKLVAPRRWLGTRYYVGQVPQFGDAWLHANQRHFLDRLVATDPRISTHLGRLEPRAIRSAAADELHEYLGAMTVRIDRGVYQDLMAIARRHRRGTVFVEKAVDVMLAVDLVIMADRDEYDAAYLLSADGDYTHAVRAARAMGKRVYAASPTQGAQLASAVNTFIRLRRDWFTDCFNG